MLKVKKTIYVPPNKTNQINQLQSEIKVTIKNESKTKNKNYK